MVQPKVQRVHLPLGGGKGKVIANLSREIKFLWGVGVGGLYQILEEMERDPTRLFSFKQWLEERLLEKQMTWQKESNFFCLFEGKSEATEREVA